MAEQTKGELRQEARLSGEISIGSGEYQNSRLLAEIITAFQAENPQVHFDIYSGNSDNIKERLERGILDLGFLLEPVDVGKYEFIRSPLPEEWGGGIGTFQPCREGLGYTRRFGWPPPDFHPLGLD